MTMLTATDDEPQFAQDALAALDFESLLDVPDVQDESGILTYYTREQVIEHMEAAVLAADQAEHSDEPQFARPFGYCVEQGPIEFTGRFSGRVSHIVRDKKDAQATLKQWSACYEHVACVFRLLELRAVPVEEVARTTWADLKAGGAP